MFLNYLALFILLAGLTAVFYTFIYIHDLPYEAAKHRNHPQKEAIHFACWLSLFTLHAIWPLVYIWAVSKQRPLDVNVIREGSDANDLSQRLSQIENRLRLVEESESRSTNSSSAL